MRKFDVFGRKIRNTRPLYVLGGILVLSLGGFAMVTSVQNNRLDQLMIDESNLQANVNDLLEQAQARTYQEISEMVSYLPTSFDQAVVVHELEVIKNLADLYSATNYQTLFTLGVNNPFDQELPTTMEYVQIDIHMVMDDATKAIDYVNHLYDHDRIFYVRFLEVSIDFEGGGIMDAEIYTFYNAIG